MNPYTTPGFQTICPNVVCGLAENATKMNLVGSLVSKKILLLRTLPRARFVRQQANHKTSNHQSQGADYDYSIKAMKSYYYHYYYTGRVPLLVKVLFLSFYYYYSTTPPTTTPVVVVEAFWTTQAGRGRGFDNGRRRLARGASRRHPLFLSDRHGGSRGVHRLAAMDDLAQQWAEDDNDNNNQNDQVPPPQPSPSSSLLGGQRPIQKTKQSKAPNRPLRDPGKPPGGYSFGSMDYPQEHGTPEEEVNDDDIYARVKYWVMGSGDDTHPTTTTTRTSTTTTTTTSSTTTSTTTIQEATEGVMDQLAREWALLNTDESSLVIMPADLPSIEEAIPAKPQQQVTPPQEDQQPQEVTELVPMPPPELAVGSMDQLAREWATINTDKVASVMPPPNLGATTTPTTVEVKEKVPVIPPKPAAGSMDQLAREWVALNTDEAAFSVMPPNLGATPTTTTVMPKEKAAPTPPRPAAGSIDQLAREWAALNTDEAASVMPPPNLWATPSTTTVDVKEKEAPTPPKPAAGSMDQLAREWAALNTDEAASVMPPPNLGATPTSTTVEVKEKVPPIPPKPTAGSMDQLAREWATINTDKAASVMPPPNLGATSTPTMVEVQEKVPPIPPKPAAGSMDQLAREWAALNTDEAATLMPPPNVGATRTPTTVDVKEKAPPIPPKQAAGSMDQLAREWAALNTDEAATVMPPPNVGARPTPTAVEVREKAAPITPTPAAGSMDQLAREWAALNTDEAASVMPPNLGATPTATQVEPKEEAAPRPPKPAAGSMDHLAREWAALNTDEAASVMPPPSLGATPTTTTVVPKDKTAPTPPRPAAGSMDQLAREWVALNTDEAASVMPPPNLGATPPPTTVDVKKKVAPVPPKQAAGAMDQLAREWAALNTDEAASVMPPPNLGATPTPTTVDVKEKVPPIPPKPASGSMDQLAREWAAINAEETASVMASKLGAPSPTKIAPKEKPIPIPPKQSMDQLAREWAARNTDDAASVMPPNLGVTPAATKVEPKEKAAPTTPKPAADSMDQLARDWAARNTDEVLSVMPPNLGSTPTPITKAEEHEKAVPIPTKPAAGSMDQFAREWAAINTDEGASVMPHDLGATSTPTMIEPQNTAQASPMSPRPSAGSMDQLAREWTATDEAKPFLSPGIGSASSTSQPNAQIPEETIVGSMDQLSREWSLRTSDGASSTMPPKPAFVTRPASSDASQPLDPETIAQISGDVSSTSSPAARATVSPPIGNVSTAPDSRTEENSASDPTTEETFTTFDGFDASPRRRTKPRQRVVNAERNETKVTLFDHEGESSGAAQLVLALGLSLLALIPLGTFINGMDVRPSSPPPPRTTTTIAPSTTGAVDALQREVPIPGSEFGIVVETGRRAFGGRTTTDDDDRKSASAVKDDEDKRGIDKEGREMTDAKKTAPLSLYKDSSVEAKKDWDESEEKLQPKTEEKKKEMLLPLRQQVQVKEDDDNSSKTAVAASSASQQEKGSLPSKEEAGQKQEETQVPAQSVKPVEEAGFKQEETKLPATTKAEQPTSMVKETVKNQEEIKSPNSPNAEQPPSTVKEAVENQEEINRSPNSPKAGQPPSTVKEAVEDQEEINKSPNSPKAEQPPSTVKARSTVKEAIKNQEDVNFPQTFEEVMQQRIISNKSTRRAQTIVGKTSTAAIEVEKMTGAKTGTVIPQTFEEVMQQKKK